jgi:hypothetical protein
MCDPLNIKGKKAISSSQNFFFFSFKWHWWVLNPQKMGKTRYTSLRRVAKIRAL